MNAGKIDFARVNSILAANFYAWAPAGKKVADEFIFNKNPLRDDKNPGSFKFNLQTRAWSDFAIGKSGGDDASLFAYLNGLDNDQIAAARLAINRYGNGDNDNHGKVISIKQPEEWAPIIPIPSQAPEINMTCVHGKPKDFWRYADKSGLWFFVARYDTFDGKQFLPWSYCENSKTGVMQWRQTRPKDRPLPLYNLTDLINRPDAPVLIVEGEKCASIALDALPDYVIVTWCGGSTAHSKSDWAPLAGRSVILWPDADEPGKKAMAALSAILGPIARQCDIIDITKNKPKGWDIADAIRDGSDLLKIISHTKSLQIISDITPQRRVSKIEQYNDLDHQGYWVTPTGAFRHCTHNATLLMANDPDWQGVLRWDEFSGDIIKVKAPPWSLHEVHSGKSPLGPWSDTDDTLLSNWFNRNGINLPDNAIFKIARLIAQKYSFHPIKEYIQSIKSDKTPRLGNAASTYLGANDPTANIAFKRWMISAVARIFSPGCKVDHMIILESNKQGRSKSKALEVLGGKWFSDTAIDVQSKDALVALRKVWVLEWGELSALRKVDVNRLKQFITSRKDDYREPYGRSVSSHLRQCVFAGTTNQEKYLRDSTGARRFWPIKCDNINIEALKRDRDQLWAEAYEQYIAGVEWWPESEEEHTALAEAAEERFESDPWEDIIKVWIDDKEHSGTKEFTTRDILNGAISRDKQHQTRADSMRIGEILKRLGMIRRRVQAHSHREYRYTNPNLFV